MEARSTFQEWPLDSIPERNIGPLIDVTNSMEYLAFGVVECKRFIGGIKPKPIFSLKNIRPDPITKWRTQQFRK